MQIANLKDGSKKITLAIIFRKTRLRTNVGAIAIAFSLCGCPRENECKKNFHLNGKITDKHQRPISGVAVKYVTHFGTEISVATTDKDGKYDYTRGPYADLGNAYLRFVKDNFTPVTTSTSPIGIGDGTCADQKIVRDAILVELNE